VENKELLLRQIDVVIEKYEYAEMAILGAAKEEFAYFAEFRSAALTTIDRIVGKDSVYHSEAYLCLQNANFMTAQGLLGILRAIRIDIENDFLETINERIHGEVFTDFLDMGEYLLKEGYKDAAAVMIGGVLESHLRQLCIKYDVSIEKADGSARKASELNNDLYGKNTYGLPDQKFVTAWLDIRNKAAHAKYEEYSKEHVDQLLLGTRGFISRYPA